MTQTHGYENAPATILVATTCACCGRPLVDATSVETGVGPECRKRHGYAGAQDVADWPRVVEAVTSSLIPSDVVCQVLTAHEADDQRRAANVLTHFVAATREGDAVEAAIVAIHGTGYVTLARKLADNLGAVHVDGDETTGELLVRSPYSDRFNVVRRSSWLRGKWDKASKTWRFPSDLASRRELYHLLRTAYPGHLLVAARGISRLSEEPLRRAS